MEDFWSTLQKGNVTILRDNIDMVDSTGVKLLSGKRVEADYVIYATGWGDHFSFFSPELKQKLGIPLFGNSAAKSANEAVTKEAVPSGSLADPWGPHDIAADELVARKLPLLAAGPKDLNGWQRTNARQKAVTVRRWRLYNRIVPLMDDPCHSIAILGQIHTTQTPTIAEIQALWTAAYLLGDISLPSRHDMCCEIAQWNAWTRKRYSSVGERYPYALFDWIPYLDSLMRDLGISSKRHKGILSDFFLPYGPHCYRGVVDEYMATREKTLPSHFEKSSRTSSTV